MPKKIPMQLLRESLVIDSTSPTWVRWRERPIHHFQDDRRWRQANARCSGKPAGNIRFIAREKRHLSQVPLGGEFYQTSRLVYALATGNDPGSNDVDHIDGDRSNNDPSNLRAVPHHLNCHNRNIKTNTSGARGVTWSKAVSKWHAYLCIKGKHINLGYYEDKNDAIAARMEGEAKLVGECSFHASRIARTATYDAA